MECDERIFDGFVPMSCTPQPTICVVLAELTRGHRSESTCPRQAEGSGFEKGPPKMAIWKNLSDLRR
jgi:hypothetical protein